MIAGGGLSGGISSTIAGGDFWQGMRQGLITSGLNHVFHYFQELSLEKRTSSRLRRSYGYSESETLAIEKWLEKHPIEVDGDIVKFKDIDDFSIQLGKKGEIVFINKEIDVFIKDQVISGVRDKIFEKVIGKGVTNVLSMFLEGGKLGDSTNPHFKQMLRNNSIQKANDVLLEYMFKPQDSNMPQRLGYKSNIESRWSQFYQYKIR